jgi:4-amino-4-deoxy-L-arabinose transferase-like glycosyltransferase
MRTAEGSSTSLSGTRPGLQILLLLAISLSIALAFQGSRGIYAPDEGYYVSVAQGMNETRDYVIPRSQLQTWLDKPPLNCWGIAAGLQVLHQNEWGARAFHGLCYVLTTLLIYSIGRSLGSRREGFLAGVIYATMIIPVTSANIITPDTPLVLWTTAAFLCFWKSLEPNARRSFLWKMLMCAAFGLGLLTKGPAALIPAGAMFVFLLLGRRAREYIVSPWVVPGFLLFCLTGLTWYIHVAREIPGALAYFIDNLVIGRTLSAKYSRNPGVEGILLYLAVIIAGTLPWSLAWWPAVLHQGKRLLTRASWHSLRADSGNLFLFTWVAVSMTVLCLARSKLPLYALPVVPALALATARMRIWHRPYRIWRSNPVGLSPRAILYLILWIGVLLALKMAAAHFPYHKDMRGLYASIKSDLASDNREVVAVEDHLEGLGLYTDSIIEHVTTRDVPYPFFVLPEKAINEIMEAHTSEYSPMFICRKPARAQYIRELLAKTGIAFRERQLPFSRYMFVCEPSRTDLGVVRLAFLGGLCGGDAGSRQHSIAAELRLVYTERSFSDGVILMGDNLCCGKSKSQRQSPAVVRGFEQAFAKLIERPVPFYAVLGEGDHDDGSESLQLQYPVFNMKGRRYYSQSFGDGLVELFALDSNTLASLGGRPGAVDSEQVDWLRASLAESRATWKLVAIHHPLYSTAREHSSDAGLIRLLEPLFTKYGVSLVIQAHNRVYERLAPIGGVVYLTCGNATGVDKGGLEPGSQIRSAGNDRSTGFVVVEFSKGACGVIAYDGLGNSVDEALLTRPGLEADSLP